MKEFLNEDIQVVDAGVVMGAMGQWEGGDEASWSDSRG